MINYGHPNKLKSIFIFEQELCLKSRITFIFLLNEKKSFSIGIFTVIQFRSGKSETYG